MRGVGATCTAPKTLRTSQTHDSPGMLQGRRGANAASSAFRQNGVSPRSGRLLGVSQTCPEGERRCWPPAAAECISAHATGMRWWTKPPVGYRSGPPRPAGADPIQSIPHRTGERNVLSAGADSEASSEAAARRERTAVCDNWASGRWAELLARRERDFGASHLITALRAAECGQLYGVPAAVPHG